MNQAMDVFWKMSGILQEWMKVVMEVCLEYLVCQVRGSEVWYESVETLHREVVHLRKWNGKDILEWEDDPVMKWWNIVVCVWKNKCSRKKIKLSLFCYIE